MFNIDNLVRKNIKELVPYSSAREEFTGNANIWLDANENPYKTNLNRYPDPYQLELKQSISKLKGVETDNIFIGNGSDEAIDLLFRAFCEPCQDKAFIFPPTYGMYEVSASINNIEVVKLDLIDNFELPSVEVIQDDIKSKGLLFICSPNNPTGTSYSLNSIREIANNFYGLVVVDEAYIDFSEEESAISLIKNIPNLVVLQTFSKAYGLAGARVGIAFANFDIIDVLNKIKPPYNINILSINAALEVLNDSKIKSQISNIKIERESLKTELLKLNNVANIYKSDANFLLVEFINSEFVFEKLINSGIIVRNRSSHIKNCLRITVGTQEENKQLLNVLKEIQS